MLVLSAVFIISIVLFFHSRIYGYSKKRYLYKILGWSPYINVILGYALVGFGYSLYSDASLSDGDILNGISLIVIGIALALSTIVFYLKHR